MDYTGEDLATVDLTLTYDYAVLQYWFRIILNKKCELINRQYVTPLKYRVFFL
jgi:hypothetical protein